MKDLSRKTWREYAVRGDGLLAGDVVTGLRRSPTNYLYSNPETSRKIVVISAGHLTVLTLTEQYLISIRANSR